MTDIEKMDREYRGGKSLRDLGRKYGESHVLIRKALLAYGTPMRPPSYRNPLRNRSLRDMHDAGHSYSEIAAITGVSRQRVHQIVKKERK